MSSFNPTEERQEAQDFVLHYLKDDGVLLTRLLSLNSSDLVVTEVINQLWLRYKTVNRLYSTVNPQRNSGSNIPTTEIPNTENNINTSTLPTNGTYQNGHSNHYRQRPPRIPPVPLPTYRNVHNISKTEKSESKSSKDTDV